ALAPKALPKRLIVVGGGYIGLELGIAYRKPGAAVSVVEAQERILPAYDSELTQPVLESVKQLGIKLYLKHSVEGFDAGTNPLQVRDPNGDSLNLETDQV
ncbi:FAD-dependent oxidoreductase, partial [Pseudomonas chlororaphis]|uniref:FAD-dependent oxidoreductase n=1 Tax=Pseudomonas chlororaphis TaxID=587753 RepID=UPI001608F4D4